jgi:hypothetical protein
VGLALVVPKRTNQKTHFIPKINLFNEKIVTVNERMTNLRNLNQPTTVGTMRKYFKWLADNDRALIIGAVLIVTFTLVAVAFAAKQ